MAFYDDVIFPASISASGFGGRRVRRTDIGTTQAGREQRSVVWLDSKRQYEAGMVPRPASQWRQIDALFDVVQGRAHGFRLKDPTDYVCDIASGLLAGYQPIDGSFGASGVGAGLPVLQIVKRYALGIRAYDRPLYKLIAGTVVVRRNGVAVTVGGGAGQVSIDINTGRVSFNADASATITAITVGASTVVTAAVTGSAVGQRLYLSGLTGADAALLNGRSWLISAKVGNAHTLTVDTTGRSITAAGTAALYPQAADVMTASCQFHVPVRFLNDELPWTWEAYNGGDPYISGSIPLIEDPEPFAT